jgi:hypothetical protein
MFENFTIREAFHILTVLPSLQRLSLKSFFEAGSQHFGAPKETGPKNT